MLPCSCNPGVEGLMPDTALTDGAGASRDSTCHKSGDKDCKRPKCGDTNKHGQIWLAHLVTKFKTLPN